MPLRMIDVGPFEVPFVFCDQCGEKIEDAADGNYQWNFGDESAGHADVYFTHKRCCHKFDESHPGGGGGAMELDVLLVCLVENLGIDLEKARARLDILNQCGL